MSDVAHRFWEPLMPRVGDRVRIRLKGECPSNHTPAELLDGDTALVIKVCDANGIYHYKEGHAEAWRGDLVPSAHRFVVEPDRAQSEIGRGAHIWLSASELEPIEANQEDK